MSWRTGACTLLLAIFSTVSAINLIQEEPSIAVTACVAGDGIDVSPALAELAALTLRIAGIKAHTVPPPKSCISPSRADSEFCREAILAELGQGRLHVALLSVPAANAPAAWQLRDTGFDDLGDVTSPTRRVCVGTPPARSLLDLEDASLAKKYYLSPREISTALQTDMLDNTTTKQTQLIEPLISMEPEWCNANSSCATIFTSDEGEARLLYSVIKENYLRGIVVPLGNELHKITKSFKKETFIVCDWSQRFNGPYYPLGPPSCGMDPDKCHFESRRLVKWINTRALARSPTAVRALNRLKINLADLQELASRKKENGVEAGALSFLAAHPIRGNSRQLRVVAFLPVATIREVYDASALAAAAALADRDLEEILPGIAFFKVQTYDDRCNAAEAYKYLIDALGTGDYDTLTAAVGPACGAPFADVVRQGPAHGLPALAYTAQSPPAPPAAPLALLAAGDARTSGEAVAALLANLGWRRVVSLSESSTHSALATASLGVDFIVHLELPDERPEYDPSAFTLWADRIARANGRIIYICVEDARAVRHALCAGHKSGLTPSNGAVWILPSSLPPNWYEPTEADTCSSEEIDEMILGHISVAPDWLIPWLSDEHGNSSKSEEIESWEYRWREACQWLKVDCAQPGPHAVLLYDTLKLWANTLKQLINSRPTALDDLHDPDLIRSLVTNATLTDYVGLTGKFEWTKLSDEGAVFARSSPLVIYQWDGKRRLEIGRWWNEKLELNENNLKWYTSDGRKPDDGHERCAMQPFADLFHTECRTASILLASILLTFTIFLLSGLVLYCKRRAEKKYRAKLEALTLRRLPLIQSVGLDPWEIARERVVINRKLGMGAFGTVYGGHALLAEDRGWTAVAVKTLKAGASNDEKVDFLSEAEVMKRFDHKNIVRLLAVITKTEPVCTVMEFMLYGDLKNYLLARRHLANADSGDDPEEQVSARRLTGMALDVARALSYLAQMKYVHRDVAARNCLVSARRVVKLADFGMTRLVFENDYYRFSRKGMLPVRWMAPESLALGIFLPASDVWSFGVLLYEIVTFGSLPFQGFSNSEVLNKVKSGQTITLPTGLKPQLEGLIKSCWQPEYKSRPTASEVAAFIADTPRLLTPCLDIPLDALTLDADSWRLPRDRAEARWVSWAAPPSATTDTTYLSTEAPRESAIREVRIDRKKYEVIVKGGGGAARAAAALQLAVIRHGLRYAARLDPTEADVCELAAKTKNISVVLAPAATLNRNGCGNGERSIDYVTSLSKPAVVKINLKLMARIHSNCSFIPSWISLIDETVLTKCSFLTSEKYNNASVERRRSKSCNKTNCVIILARNESKHDYRVLEEFKERANAAKLELILFKTDVSFRREIFRLRNRSERFLFIDEDLWNLDPDIVSLDPPPCTKGSIECSNDLDTITTIRIGDGRIVKEYAPPIYTWINQFSPKEKDIKNVLEYESNSFKNVSNIEEAACAWALDHKTDFEEWFQKDRKRNDPLIYRLDVYLCQDDPYNALYEKVMKIIGQDYFTQTTKDVNYKTELYYSLINCSDNHELRWAISRKRKDAAGTITWAWNAGVLEASNAAQFTEVPLMLAGPASDSVLGRATYTASGKMSDLAQAYRYFLSLCKWKRIAILSDETVYSENFAKAIVRDGNLNYAQAVITNETVLTEMKKIKQRDARIFIVNTSCKMSKEILLIASNLFTPLEKYVWIVRDWCILKDNFSLNGLTHFTIESSRRGGYNFTGSVDLRLKLEKNVFLWRNTTVSPGISQLTDAILMLTHGFDAYHKTDLSNRYDLHGSGTAKDFYNAVNTMNSSGTYQNRMLRNYSLHEPLFYLEQWHTYERRTMAIWKIINTTVVPEWSALNNTNSCNSLLDAERIDDGKKCLMPSGDHFDPICHDLTIILVTICLILICAAIYYAQKLRKKRLIEEREALVARLLENRQKKASALVSFLVERESIRLLHEIGSGCYGRVHFAELTRPGHGTLVVAAKEPHESFTLRIEENEILREACVLARLEHSNVIRLMGVCLADGPPLVLMEHAIYLDLQRYLTERKHMIISERRIKEENECDISDACLTRWGCDAVTALEYLGKRRLVHRDIRAANCLVDKQRSLKVADFGMARELDEEDATYMTCRKALFPVLWMAPESLEKGVFSLASDIWAMGVLLLEIATIGARPYGDWPTYRVVKHVASGGCPPLPPDTLIQMRITLEKCWHQDPEMRVTATELRNYLMTNPKVISPALLAPELPLTSPIPDDYQAP
ncbi:unnamed protein product [Leptosia nina]|uniref:Protein kinase domain-containing protein n=1 Tax=Leptosia nina TaxID=320188 RepID=A0AAV1J5V0_9NEOP